MAGQRVLITGASSGIGAETARLLGERGDDVALVARSRSGLEEAAEAVRRNGGRALVLVADVADRAAVARAVERTVAEFGGLDGVIVNAGVAGYGPFSKMAPEDFERAVAVTLLGAVNVVGEALPHLETTAGTIVATGSVASKWPTPLMVPYATAKHGLRGFLNSLRVELRATRSPVRIAMVHPGPVDSPFWVHASTSDESPPKFPGGYPPEKVAAALVRALDHPRPERTLGLAMKAAGVLHAIAGPVFDLGAVVAARWSLDNPADQEPGEGLWEPTGDGRIDGGLAGEPRTVGGKA